MPCHAEFEPTTNDVLGAISLIFWSITLLVLIKYVFIVIRANDQGEGEDGDRSLWTNVCVCVCYMMLICGGSYGQALTLIQKSEGTD